jgi:hypothetical protein
MESATRNKFPLTTIQNVAIITLLQYAHKSKTYDTHVVTFPLNNNKGNPLRKIEK